MQTRCPHCQTHFRVTAEQLKIRQGKVRCGACRQVFDALESLSDEIIAVVPETPTMTTPGPAGIAASESLSALPEIAVPPESEPEPEPEPVQETEPEPESDQAAEAVSSAKSAQAPPEAPVVPERARRWPWLAGIAVLSLLLAGQLLYIFRNELAVISPELRPFLDAACQTLGCTLSRPVRPDLVGIETSDLVPDGEALRLTATLKNRAPFTQDYPHLELTLTDTQDAALVRKVLTPADYLPAGRDAAAGFAAQGEIALDLRLTTDDVPAVGYRLYLFYP